MKTKETIGNFLYFRNKLSKTNPFSNSTAKTILSLLLLSMLFLFFSLSCKKEKKEDPPPVKPKIEIGGITDLISQSVGNSGGLIIVSKPGDILNGMQITIPQGAFPASNLIKISSAPILKHDFGPNFNPISPLIKINSEEDYAETALRIKIPITLPTGYFATAFFYDETTQRIEPIPTIGIGSDYIIIATRNLPANKNLNKSGTAVETNIIISSIIESALDNGAVISTGFEPGYDDWEFTNFGSYAEPAGQCMGQSLSEVFYFYEKKLKSNAAPLYHHFDQIHDGATNPAKLWQDNPDGYRLANVFQRMIISHWDSVVSELDAHIANPVLTWKLFVHGMLATGAPQVVYIRNSTSGSAHAIVAFKVNLSEKKLYIADPNFPSQIRSITFKNNKFEPYNTKTKEGEQMMLFDEIGFLGVSALIPWSKLKTKYSEFENHSIGNDIFPAYTLYKDNTSGTIVKDGITVTSSSIKIICKSTACEGSIAGTDHLQPIVVFNSTGDPMDYADSSNQGVVTYYLNEGDNKIGIYIPGLMSDKSQQYIDFKWMNIKYDKNAPPSLVITPGGLDGVKGINYKFTATLQGGSLPANREYQWLMGDNNPAYTVNDSNTISFKYKTNGNRTISCNLIDANTSKVIATGSTIISVRDPANPFEYFSITKIMTMQLSGHFIFDDTTYFNSGPFTISSDHYYKGNSSLNWNGNNFTLNYTYYTSYLTDTTFINGNTSGSISNDGMTIVTLSIHQLTTTTGGSKFEQTYNFKNIPITSSSPTASNSQLLGAMVENYITNFTVYTKYKDYQTQVWKEYTTTKMNYSDLSLKPNLWLSFY